MNIEFVTPTFNEFTLNFPEPTEVEVTRAAQELAHSAAVSAMVELLVAGKAFARKARRNDFRLWAHAASFRNGKLVRGPGFTFKTPDVLPFDMDHGYDSKRAERRRVQRGRV